MCVQLCTRGEGVESPLHVRARASCVSAGVHGPPLASERCDLSLGRRFALAWMIYARMNYLANPKFDLPDDAEEESPAVTVNSAPFRPQSPTSCFFPELYSEQDVAGSMRVATSSLETVIAAREIFPLTTPGFVKRNSPRSRDRIHKRAPQWFNALSMRSVPTLKMKHNDGEELYEPRSDHRAEIDETTSYHEKEQAGEETNQRPVVMSPKVQPTNRMEKVKTCTLSFPVNLKTNRKPHLRLQRAARVDEGMLGVRKSRIVASSKTLSLFGETRAGTRGEHKCLPCARTHQSMPHPVQPTQHFSLFHKSRRPKKQTEKERMLLSHLKVQEMFIVNGGGPSGAAVQAVIHKTIFNG